MRALAGLLLALALGPAAAGGRPVAQPPADAAIAQSNAALVRQAFAAWREGRGSLFDLLHEDVEWVVAGTSPVSGRYGSRQAFLEQAVAPIGARLATPIAPEVRQVLAQGDAVAVLWDGVAPAASVAPTATATRGTWCSRTGASCARRPSSTPGRCSG